MHASQLKEFTVLGFTIDKKINQIYATIMFLCKSVARNKEFSCSIYFNELLASTRSHVREEITLKIIERLKKKGYKVDKITDVVNNSVYYKVSWN
jgi:hypothetical protein